MKNIRIKLILIPIVLCMGFTACGNHQPLSSTEPDDSEPAILFKKGKGGDENGDRDPNPDSEFLMVRRREEAEEGVSKAVIGPEGGFLVHAAHRLDISPGALSEATQITFSMPVNKPDTLMFDLGPDGIQFSAPVTLTLNWDHAFTSDLDEEFFTVVVWNPQTQLWESVPTGIDTEANEASGDLLQGSLQHFSRYSIRKF